MFGIPDSSFGGGSFVVTVGNLVFFFICVMVLLNTLSFPAVAHSVQLFRPGAVYEQDRELYIGTGREGHIPGLAVVGASEFFFSSSSCNRAIRACLFPVWRSLRCPSMTFRSGTLKVL